MLGKKPKALVVEDDPIFQEEIRSTLREMLSLDFAKNLSEARNYATIKSYDIILLDKNLPDGTGVSLIPELKMLNPYSVVIVLTSDPTDQSVTEALDLGASDYLVKSANIRVELPGRIQVAHGRLLIEQRCKKAETIVKEIYHTDIVGNSPATTELKEQIRIYGPSQVNVLVTGETGTGKELVARALNLAWSNKNRNFVTVNCGAVSPQLIESELFGHVKGAFTGAISDKEGRIELANGGDLFLDEIGELPLDLQAKLLRVLQDGELYRVGSNTPRHVKIRVISATNKNVHEMVEEGKFREDLLFRINGAEIQTVPLRDRTEDIESIAIHFLNTVGGSKYKFEPGSIHSLMSENWKGNVRELKHRIERAVAIAKSEERHFIRISDLRTKKSPSQSSFLPGLRTDIKKISEDGYKNALMKAEREYLEAALKLTSGDVIEAARQLNLSKTTLYRRLQLCGLQSTKTFKHGVGT